LVLNTNRSLTTDFYIHVELYRTNWKQLFFRGNISYSYFLPILYIFINCKMIGYTLYTIKSNLQIDEDKQFILIFFTKQMLICAIYMFNSVSFVFEIYFLVMDILSSIYMLCLIDFVTFSIIYQVLYHVQMFNLLFRYTTI
jgi:hypothetical protein